MADPLSIAASIAGVISLADIVFIRTRKYLNSSKNADKEVKDLSQEVLLLSGALHSLSKLAQVLDGDGLKDQHIENLRMHHIAACHGTLDEVGKKLKKFEDNATKRKLVWPFVSDRTAELLAEISRHRANVNLALTADSMGTMLQILSKTKEVHGNTEKLLDEAKKTREIVTRIHQDSGRKDILNYFLPYNPQQNYEMSLSLRHPRTGLWLTRRPDFQTWLEHPDSALWLSGIPGAGKTVLAGTLIEEALRKSSDDTATAFFFCDYKDTRTQKANNVLSALASQLAIQKEDAYCRLERYHRDLHPERALERRPDVPGLQRVLKDIVKSFNQVYLIVDGLDECGDSTDDVIDSILDIVECSDNISTAFLSRDEYNIRDRLEDDFTGVEIAAQIEDITEYVTSEIEKRISNKSLRIDDLGLKGEILERLINGAKGMFRWVACQLDFLGDCLSDRECRDALIQLPPGLNESYMRILQRVPTGKERIVQMILNFIAYAKPKLDIPILREALSVSEKVDKDDVLDSLSIIREDSIMRLCRSLIRKSNDGYYFEFAHFSVQEFLEGEMNSVPEFEAFRVSESICQLLLAKQRIKYLLFQDFASLPTETPGLREYIEIRMKNHPFYQYAAVCWPVFARRHWADKSLVDIASLLFRSNKTGNFVAWALELTNHAADRASSWNRFIAVSRGTALHVHHLQHISGLLPQVFAKTFTALHMAAALSLPVICSSLIEQGVCMNQRSPFGCPLQCAVQGLCTAALDEGDEVDRFRLRLVDPYTQASYWQERSDAPEFGRESTIRLLLGSGATYISVCSSPFAGSGLINVALKLACDVKDIGAISALLEAGYEPDDDSLSQVTRIRDTGFRLHWDKFGLERLILCLGPMIDISAAHFRLCQALWSFAIDVGCKFVQDLSIVDTRISLSEAALTKTIFASIKNVDINTLTQALKDPRVDIRGLSDNHHSGTVFQVWSSHFGKHDLSDRLTVMKMLLSAGMEVNQPNHDGLLPIHELARCQHKRINYDGSCYDVLADMIDEFVRRGTGCTAKSRENQNVFHLGLESIEFIKAVLEAETDEIILTALRTQDSDGYTPITLALESGREDVALLLLERSHCDPEALRGPASVLALCVAGGAQRAFNVLMNTELGFHSIETTKETLLHHLGPKASPEYVHQLIRMFPDGLRSRVDARLPLDAYLKNCINSELSVLDPEALQLLAEPGSKEFDPQEKRLVWEDFTLRLRHAERLTQTHINEVREGNTEKAVAALLRLGFLRSYEAVTHAPGILPLLGSLRNVLDDVWPLTLKTLCEILEQTTRWESLSESVEILRLLQVAVKFDYVSLVEVLLGNSVCVHQRIDEMSALELACLKTEDGPDCQHIFTLLLDHADTSRLDEVNPHQGQKKGLIHYLAGHGKQWKLEKLLSRRVDVNLRTNTCRMEQPALVYHFFEGSLETAMTLLEMGANPATADSRGMDAALTAAYQGYMDFLLHIYAATDLKLNWEQTCTVGLEGMGGMNITASGVNALHLAANQGRCDVLRFYMDKGLLTDVNAVSVELWTPMHVAALTGQIDAIKFLHSRGGCLDLKSADGSLPLHLAVRNGCAEVVRFLVESGSTMDVDARGVSPMGYAMQQQNQSILDCLQTSKQYLDYQSEPERRKKDLIYSYEQALVRGDVKECELLRGLGCPVNADLPGQRGRSALVLAIENFNEELIRWLLGHAAKVAEENYIADRGWFSALQAMIMRPALNNLLPLLLQKYLSQGGSVTADEASLTCIAIDVNNNHGLRLILDHIVQHEAIEPNIRMTEHTDHRASIVNLRTLNGHGQTPLHWAACRGNYEAAQVLLNHGADVNALNNQYNTPLQVAIRLEPLYWCPAARLLLRRGAALELRDGWGYTAAMLASQRGNTDLVRLLEGVGADLTARDFSSFTCLHLAALKGCLEVFTWLVNRGLQLHAKNSLGWAAIQYASFNKVFSSFLLNFGSAFEDIDAISYKFPGRHMNPGPAWLNEHFNIYLRRLGLERLRALANPEPADSWSPLCMLASIGQTLAVTNILRLGADVDFEGSPHGSALMAACSSGRLESIRILVRHGAAISYLGDNGIRSAVGVARNHETILSWLLVDRFTEQRKLSGPAYADSAADSAEGMKPWSGVVEIELTITGRAERQVHESAMGYWFRLMAVKRNWRGKVVDQNKLAQTHRPSRLIPDEPVRICPGYYGTPKELK